MKTVTYHLLVNLSVSDLLITCLCGPVHVINTLVLGEKEEEGISISDTIIGQWCVYHCTYVLVLEQ